MEYCDNHTHGTQFAHLRMSEEIRSLIAGKLASRVDSKKLLREIREEINSLNGRDRILVHKDILNIKHQYNIHEAARDKNDLKSTSIWVEEFRAQEYDPISPWAKGHFLMNWYHQDGQSLMWFFDRPMFLDNKFG